MRLPFIISFNLALFLILSLVPIEALQSGETFVVTANADSGPGTLRRALQDAKDGDTITFDSTVFPPGNPNTISLNVPLPSLDQGNLIIDASNAGVVIDGSGINLAEYNGLQVASDNNVIRGLHLMNFSKAGIALEGDIQNNIIGGDRNIGNGPSGQGNTVTRNGTFGIGMWGESTSNNTILGNIIGSDATGTIAQGNFSGGVFIDGPNHNLIENNLIDGYNDNGIHIGGGKGHNTVCHNHINTDIANSWSNGISIDNSGFNTIGPGNVITNNGHTGIWIFRENSQGNRITKNSICNNGKQGIVLEEGGNNNITRPYIFEFDMQAGTLTGIACPNCTVEIFSDSDNQGEIYEGSTTADNSGLFTFSKEAPFTHTRLTATATDVNNNTSEFSPPTQDSPNGNNFIFQEGNYQKLVQFQHKTSTELPDDLRLGCSVGVLAGDLSVMNDRIVEVIDMGAKRIDIAMGMGEAPVDWDFPETEIPEELDTFINRINELGVILNWEFHYFDKIGHAAGEALPIPRFTTQDEIDKFLDYVRLIVSHFKDRVQYYTIWTEPDACGGSIEIDVKCIEALDYVNLVKQTIPVIKQENPQAKVVSGPNVLYFGREHLFTLVNSDAIQLFDVISTHPMYDQAPDQDFIGYDLYDQPFESYAEYYYNYPAFIDSILQIASDHGFQGEYWAGDLTWFTTEENTPYTEWKAHTVLKAAKYQARAITMHLGIDAGVDPCVYPGLPEPFDVAANLYTILAGTKPYMLSEQIECGADNIVNYGFLDPNGDKLLAIWNNNAAADYDAGVPATLTLPGFANKKMIGIDVLNCFQQELMTENENSNLVIRNLMIKDYPIILLITSSESSVTEPDTSPCTFALYQNYPNPFNPNTSIKFQVPVHSQLNIKIYNVRGQEIRNFVKKDVGPGYHTIEWNGQDTFGKTVVTGIYLIKMKSGDYVKTKKCLLLK